MSFVNNICTIKGGQHVAYITDQVTKKLQAMIAKKHKKVAATIKPQHIKNHLSVFVNSIIENPAFDSQTKVNLTSKKAKFGSSCELEDKIMKKIFDSGLVEGVLNYAQFKENKELKKTDGTKKGRLTGIPKLEDANDAGTKNGHLCTLILTEGDSAKALVVSGLSVIGRDRYGVFPLKGKLLNVREASHKQMMNNEEISNLKKILGLQSQKIYTDTKTLRYGHLMVMTDQDHDGSHIKGLIINLFHHFWPSLLKIPGFLLEFITPIVKCSKDNFVQTFYTLPEYATWKESNNNGAGWTIKYYKGLGTSTATDAKQYFSNLDEHQINFAWESTEDDKNINLAFSKKLADARKDWLAACEPGIFLNQNVEKINYSDFVNKELILFSAASNQRAIPSMVDGLKPGQRKILFSCFKRKLTQEIKVHVSRFLWTCF